MISLYLPDNGKIVDMGSGTGQTTHSIAQSYPRAEVIGIDIDSQMVNHAGKKYKAKNLTYKQNDISKKIFPENSLDAVINSSAIHHITSFSGEGYDLFEGLFALSSHIKQLKEGGVLVLRDFVIPKGPFLSRVKLRRDDGDNSSVTQNVQFLPLSGLRKILKNSSTFRKFQIFAKQFRSSVHKKSVPFKIISTNKKWVVIEADFRTLMEFALHKDYIENWQAEIKEEYLFVSPPSCFKFLKKSCHLMKKVLNA